MAITNAQGHSTKFELRFCAGLYPVRSVSGICDGENHGQWFRLERRVNLLTSNVPHHWETSHLICNTNRLYGFLYDGEHCLLMDYAFCRSAIPQKQFIVIIWLHYSLAYLKPCQTSKIEHFWLREKTIFLLKTYGFWWFHGGHKLINLLKIVWQ